MKITCNQCGAMALAHKPFRGRKGLHVLSKIFQDQGWSNVYTEPLCSDQCRALSAKDITPVVKLLAKSEEPSDG